MKLTMREYFMQNVESSGVLKKLVREEIVVDNVADLPTADYKEGQILAIGSAVWDVSTGDFYGLDSNGVWINQKTGTKTIQITQQPADAEVTSGESVKSLNVFAIAGRDLPILSAKSSCVNP